MNVECYLNLIFMKNVLNINGNEWRPTKDLTLCCLVMNSWENWVNINIGLDNVLVPFWHQVIV